MCHLSRDVANTTWRVLSSDERGKYLALPRKAPITENGVQVVNASEFYCLLCSMEEADTHYFEGFTYEELIAHLHHQYVHISISNQPTRKTCSLSCLDRLDTPSETTKSGEIQSIGCSSGPNTILVGVRSGFKKGPPRNTVPRTARVIVARWSETKRALVKC